MTEEYHQMIVGLMAEKISKLEGELRAARAFNDIYMDECERLDAELQTLKPKRGCPAKKRGPGRPKGSKNVRHTA
jgi:hypothetical protein